MDECWRYPAKWNKPDIKAHIVWSHLHETPGLANVWNRKSIGGSQGLEVGRGVTA